MKVPRHSAPSACSLYMFHKLMLSHILPHFLLHRSNFPLAIFQDLLVQESSEGANREPQVYLMHSLWGSGCYQLASEMFTGEASREVGYLPV